MLSSSQPVAATNVRYCAVELLMRDGCCFLVVITKQVANKN